MDVYVHGERRALPEGFDEFLDPATTAIVSIDMHRSHLDDGAACPCPGPRAREIVGPIDTFHDKVRQRGIPVIHVGTVLRRGGIDDAAANRAAWRFTFPLFVGDIPNADEHALEGTQWPEFVTRVDEGDLQVRTKKRLSVFYPTDLDFLLRNLRVRAVVLNGGFTDCCVLNAAFDASNRDYRVIVAADLVRGTTPELEDAALKMVSLHCGLVVDSSDLLAEWDRRAGDIPAEAPHSVRTTPNAGSARARGTS